MNTWRSRALMAALIVAAMFVHSELMHFKPRGELGMLIYHGSAALFDLFLLRICHFVIECDLCDDMMALCIASIVGNALGWAAYMAYAPPIYYNVFMWGVAAIQGLRLLMTDGDATNFIRSLLVRRRHHRGLRPILGAKKQ